MLCSLLCEQTAVSTSQTTASACAVRDRWLAGVAVGNAIDAPNPRNVSQDLAALLSQSSRPLIWLDGADVNTTRAAVALTAAAQGAIHVGANSGDKIAHQVLKSDRWLGTTLGEIHSRSDVVLTVGNTLLSEMPRVVSQVICPDHRRRPNWMHISEHQCASDIQPDIWIDWPRDRWYASLTAALMELNETGGAIALPEHVETLVGRLTKAKYATILWNTNEFVEGVEELVVRRLASMARLLSEQTRVSLLGLQQSPGHITASETLLWLTGCASSALFSDGDWTSYDEGVGFDLEQWQDRFDTIVVVRSVPSPIPLPQLPNATYLVCHDRQLRAGEKNTRGAQHYSVCQAGVEKRAALFRGDAAVVLNTGQSQTTALPSAEDVLLESAALLRPQNGVPHAD